MQTVVVTAAQDGNHVPWLKVAAMVKEPLEEAFAIQEGNAIAFSVFEHVKPLGLIARELYESVHASAVFDVERVEINPTHVTAAAFTSPEPPSTGKPLPGVHNEIDAHLRNTWLPLRAKNKVLIAVESERIPALEVSVSPLVPQLAILLALFRFRFIEGQTLRYFIGNGLPEFGHNLGASSLDGASGLDSLGNIRRNRLTLELESIAVYRQNGGCSHIVVNELS
jgi:hypothetical protein